MSKTAIDRTVLTDPSWWHWALTIPLLATHVGGVPGAIELAIGLCIVMSGYYLIRLKRLKPLPVQLRIAFLGLLLLGLLPAMHWLHWVQLVGTTVMVAVGYCLLGRTLNLAPFNRQEPLSLSLLWRTFFRDPCAGGLVRWSADPTIGSAGCCSLHSRQVALCSLASNRRTSIDSEKNKNRETLASGSRCTY